MKPLYLEMQAFGPFRGRETVDFEALGKQELFLIKGPTGSGKTTIFDAMTIALYGGCSGESSKMRGGRNEFTEWRCNQADEKVDTFVSFTFSVEDRIYRFTRSWVLRRTSRTEKYDASVLSDQGVFVPLFENPKEKDLNQKAEELIGLDKEQFRQVVLLPQGKFERFLTASSEEKEKILQKIFGTGAWARFTDRFYKTVSTRLDALTAEKREVDASLAEEGRELTSTEGLLTLVKERECERAVLQENHRAFDGEARQEKLNQDRLLSERFHHLHDLEDRLAKLVRRADEIDRKRKQHQAAEQAEVLRGFLEERDRTSKDAAARLKAADALKAETPAIEEKASRAKKEQEEHLAASPVAELQNRIGSLSDRRESYRNLKSLKDEVQTATRQWSEERKAREKAQKTADLKKNEAARAYDKQEKAQAEAADARHRYYAGIYGEIAQDLKEMEPCPVCGSIHHPNPAMKAPDSVTKERMEELEALAEKARKCWRTSEDARKSAEEELRSRESRESEAAVKKTEAEAKLSAGEKNRIPGIETLEGLEQEILGLQDAIEDYEKKSKELADRRSKAEAKLAAHKATTENALREAADAAREADKADTALREALKDHGYAAAADVQQALLSAVERNRLLKQITEYESEVTAAKTEWEQREKELEGFDAPDEALFAERQSAIREEADRFAREGQRVDGEIRRLREKHRRLSVKADHYRENLAQAENDMAIARKLRGDTGIGIQRYVLGIMFGQVIGEANVMLSRVHGGRYRLIRTDDKGAGNKRGLELKVHDRRSPEQEGRSVGMLSGGEKFLVSLALSIGMSSIAQKSGVSIEALFIDEGFGTLDESSIADAMEVLSCVRRGGSMIGIISHVQLLESTIPSVLEVEKTEAGSHIHRI